MEEKYQTQIMLGRYLPVRDVPKYYRISEETITELIKSKKIRYAELKDPHSYKRIPHVDMAEVLTVLGRRVRLFHLENIKEDEE